jgi:hypothetical protein
VIRATTIPGRDNLQIPGPGAAQAAGAVSTFVDLKAWIVYRVSFPGGSVDLFTKDDIAAWGDSMNGIFKNIPAKRPGGP